MTETETDSGAHALPYRINKKYLGEPEDDIKLDDLESMARISGGDFALELRGKRLHLFRVLVRDVS